MPLPTLNFITSNPHKLSEVRAILGDLIPLTSHALDITEIQGSMEDVARDKARRAAELVGGPVLTEDTGLCFGAFGEAGLPGPYIKWFLGALGLEGLNKLLVAYEDKSAEAVCTFAYCEGPGCEARLFQGRTRGRIVPARGPADFGWDPIFEYEGETYAEMDKAKKNSVSHRGKALAKLKVWVESQMEHL